MLDNLIVTPDAADLVSKNNIKYYYFKLKLVDEN